ncbi:MAG: RlmE family RNA methyltransferase [Proteobacteria bacterium]|nr:RlmE family RNA methyltransferase [Pseudomonadota bacterium]NDC26007.1 RlmE family RNA methyltransferase [Pseudomonadota bacterium]
MRKWHDDPFTKKARKEKYEARSVYKLEEIDQRERVFEGVNRVLDLGAAPGSWTQYCLKKLSQPQAQIFAVDIAPLGFSHPKVIFIQKPIEDIDLSALVGTEKIDLVLSDMAPKTTGVHDTDVARSFDLASVALEAAKRFLKPGGTFIVKLFMGESFEEYRNLLRQSFKDIRVLRPESTRKHSREIFFVAKGFKESP